MNHNPKLYLNWSIRHAHFHLFCLIQQQGSILGTENVKFPHKDHLDLFGLLMCGIYFWSDIKRCESLKKKVFFSNKTTSGFSKSGIAGKEPPQLCIPLERAHLIKLCIWETGHALRFCFPTYPVVSAEASSHLKTRHLSSSLCLAMTLEFTSFTEWKSSDWPPEHAATASTRPQLKTTLKAPSSPSTQGWDYYWVFLFYHSVTG